MDVGNHLFTLGLTVMLGIIGFLSARTLKKIDANQTALFKKYDDHETRLSHLEGEHRVLSTKHK